MVSRRGLVGYVTVSVPFDATLVDALRQRSGLAPADSLVILRHNSIVASSPAVAGSVTAPVGQMKTVAVGGDRFRTLVAPAVADDPGVRFAVLSPQSLIDAANSSSRNRLLLGLIASLALVSLVAYFEGRSIVRTLRGLAEAAHGIARGRLSERVPVRGRDEFAMLGTAFNDMANQLEARLAELEAERGRLRDAITRFGEALAATHDINQLLRVIVEAAVEATGANGARLIADDGTIVETGEPDSKGERLEFGLTAGRTTFGALTITGDGFDDEQRLAAGSLASHAAIALENARLHRIVERQALVDGLTGIANRRQCEDAMTAEIARAERLGSTLDARARGPRRLQGGQRRPRPRRRRRRAPRSSQRRSARPSATPISPAAGAARSSSSSCPGPTRRAAHCSPIVSARPSRSARLPAATGKR